MAGWNFPHIKSYISAECFDILISVMGWKVTLLNTIYGNGAMLKKISWTAYLRRPSKWAGVPGTMVLMKKGCWPRLSSYPPTMLKPQLSLLVFNRTMSRHQCMWLVNKRRTYPKDQNLQMSLKTTKNISNEKLLYTNTKRILIIHSRSLKLN